ncbi:SLC13 family permease [Marinobacterium arenosum]|uniref:SLC13 family permease n=1 Tax=Marinobacterium arenosum TaxID=2862496 RepID=UPI001C971EC7|nr:SLC13 family permease [Marinobacterium arenosum]MBY4677114.1 anion permease [Marinobacterium arenosum]
MLVTTRHQLTRHPARLIAGLILLLALLLALFPPALMTVTQAQTAALVLAALGLWATSVIPEHLTALLLFLGAMLLSLAPAEVVFSGFYSAATWMIFAGFVIGMAFKSTGLGQRLADHLTIFAGSYPLLIGGIMLSSTALGFLMPSSMGRVVLMVPIVMALAERCGFRIGSNGHTGLALAVAFGTHVPTFAVLPANVPNMVMAGAVETIYGLSFGYAEYLLLHFPVLGLLKGLLVTWLIIRLFPDSPRPAGRDAQRRPLQASERYLLLLLLIALALWISDGLHHVSPAWVALGAAVILLLPRLGLVGNEQFQQQFSFSTLLFIAGILGMGTLLNHSGLGELLAGQLAQLLPLEPGNSALNFASLSATAFLTSLATGLPGVPAVLTPFAGQLAETSGLPLTTVLMTQVIGFSTFLLPYQSGPLLVALKMSGMPMAHAIRFCVLQALLSIVLLVPLDYGWWRLLGWL